MLNKYKHIIWDWNGTLLNDDWLCIKVLNSLLTARNMKTVTTNEYKAQFDFPVIEYYKKLGFDFQREDFSDVAKQYIQAYEQRKKTCGLQPNALKALNFFKDKNLTQSVLSAYQQDKLDDFINFFKIRHFFTAVVGLKHDYADSKVQLGKEFINSQHLEPENILFIGDTTHDFEVANAMKVDALLIADGHQPKEKLQKCPCQVLNNLHDLLNLN